jgi:hypothetical protein
MMFSTLHNTVGHAVKRREAGHLLSLRHDLSFITEVNMHELLRTYLVGEDRKYELYGEVDMGDRVTKVLEYAYRSLNPEQKTAQWVCLGPVDIGAYTDSRNNPAMAYDLDRKNNDISSIRELCNELGKR